MNDMLHVVANGWYRLLVVLILSFSSVVALGCGAVLLVPALESFGQSFALTPITLVFAGIVVVYCTTIYWVVARKKPSTATFIASMLFALLLLDGLTLSNHMPGGWLYVGGWMINIFFSGTYGSPMIMGSLVLTFILVLLGSDFSIAEVSTQQIALLGGGIVVALISYFFWRHRYSDVANLQLDRLTGMLRNKEEQAAILIQSIADGVIVTDTNGKITVMNRTAANMTGWPVDEALGVDVTMVVKVAKEKGEPISAEEYPFKAVLVHKAYINQILQMTTRSGKKQVVSLVISPVVTSAGQVFGAVAILRDISEQHAAEAQRGEFISTASHEMRTPVAAIEGYLSLALNDKVSTIDSRARGYLEKAHASTEHLGKLFQDLLTSAKAEDGRLSSHPVVVEVGAFLQQLVEDMRFTAEKKKLVVEFTTNTPAAGGGTIDATAPVPQSGAKTITPLYYVYTDPERLREVITNLFDNAIKYTDQGKITIGLTGDTDVVQIFVRDTGAGIPAEDVPHLFQKFYRVDNSATRVIGGTGLGLFIARKIIELYQGRIWVESELGKGSTFYINLPRLSPQKAQEVQAASATLEAKAAATQQKP